MSKTGKKTRAPKRGQATGAGTPSAHKDGRDGAGSAGLDAGLKDVLDVVRVKGGRDFRNYKPNTLERRIRRRMTLTKTATFADYARWLREDPEEASLLQKDLLIGVTEFFRQPEAWDVLGEKAVAPLVEEAVSGTEIRIWVPGCSTGEEAYSLAMLLAEKAGASGKNVGFQIFATDSDGAALMIARAGVYTTEKIGRAVAPARLKRFFTRRDGNFQVDKEIRGKIVFAPQDITSDPPFSRMDLISCRNLLIYLNSQVQQKIIATFHFALREGGYLFLGSAETVGDRVDLFEPVSKKWRIYRRIGVGRTVGVEIPVVTAGGSPAGLRGLPAPPSASRLDLPTAAQQILLGRFAPASVMIDRKLEVLYVHGPVEEYLTFPAGELTTRVVDMAREGLRARLRGAIGQCLETGRPVSIIARVRRGAKSVPVRATVSPLRIPREVDGLLLVTFEDYVLSAAKPRRRAGEKDDILQLQDELKVTREELRSTIDQLEGSNDKFKASNEEVTAANEELQSANEELETSKEELQSLNEELATINGRLQEKVDELESVNNDLINLLASTSIATVFLDKDLRVKRYTPASTHLFSLIPSDVGRPIADVLRRFRDETLLEDAAKVRQELTPLAKDVQAEDGRWFIRRITPYRTRDDRIEGVVVTFVDVCDLKQNEETLRRKQFELEAAREEAENKKRLLEAVMEALPVGVAITDVQGGNVQTNRAYEKLWGLARPRVDSVEDDSAYKAWWTDTGKAVAPEDWASAKAVREGRSIVGQLLEIERTDGSRAFVLNAASPVLDAGGDIVGSAVAIQDITPLRKAEAALRDTHERAEWLARFPDENPNPVVRAKADGTALYANPAAQTAAGWRCRAGQTLPESMHPLIERAMAQGKPVEEDLDLDGTPYTVSAIPIPAKGYANVYGRDVTARRRAEQELQRLNAELEERVAEQIGEIRRTHEAVKAERQRLYDVLETLPAYVILLSKDYHVPFANRFFRERFGEAGGRCCHDFLFQRDDPCPGCETFKVFQTAAPHHWEWTGPDGRNYDIHDFPFKDTDGSPLILEMGIDITEIKRAEGALKEANETLERRVAERTAALTASEARFRTLFETMSEGFSIDEILCDDNGVPFDLRYLEVNPAFERQTELKAADVLGRTALELFPQAEPVWIERFGKVALTGEPAHFEAEFGPLGRWFEVSAYRTEPGRFAVVFFDVTKRKRAEEEVRKGLEELRAANEELARFNRAAVGRETRMIELKREINELRARAGEPPRFPLDFEKDPESDPSAE
jgi:PAS domain S-box-containing protein